MQLWQYLLTADRERDLTELGAAKTWLFSHGWWPRQNGAPVEDPWTATAQAKWPVNLVAVRNLASRMKGGKWRRSDASDQANRMVADRVLGDYAAMMRPSVEYTFIGKPTEKGPPPEKAPAGLAIFPTIRGSARRPHAGGFTYEDLEYFWQCVILSLLRDGISICETCGKMLELTTPTGRPTRLKKCGACRSRAWAEKLSAKQVRDIWRANKRKQRKKQKRKTTTRRKQP